MSASARARGVVGLPLVIALLSGCETEMKWGGAYDPSGDACNTTNPLTGACSCPADFSTLNLSEAGVTVCWTDDGDSRWEWGGAFDLTGSTCATQNPRTGDCTCPSGFTELFLAEAGASLCWAQPGTQTGWQWGGAYDRAADGSCNTANPRTEACDCPDGFTALELADSGFALCWSE